jgi:hypothetical protein
MAKRLKETTGPIYKKVFSKMVLYSTLFFVLNEAQGQEVKFHEIEIGDRMIFQS